MTGPGGRVGGAGQGTRDRIISTAERLFAERGVDAVSLREISRQSGARNAMATQYHFGDRAGVVEAIMAKHQPGVEAARAVLLDDLEAALSDPERPADSHRRALAGALVRPLAAKLADRDGGPDFLQVYAEVLERDPAQSRVANPSLDRWRRLADRLLDPDALRLHRRFTALLHTTTELSRRAGSGPHTDDRLFTSYLVDVVTAILAFPVSAETRRLAGERDRARSARSNRRSASG